MRLEQYVSQLVERMARGPWFLVQHVEGRSFDTPLLHRPDQGGFHNHRGWNRNKISTGAATAATPRLDSR